MVCACVGMMDSAIRQAALRWRWTIFSAAARTGSAVGGRVALERTTVNGSVARGSQTLTRSKATLATPGGNLDGLRLKLSGTRPLMRGVPLPGPTRSAVAKRCVSIFFSHFVRSFVLAGGAIMRTLVTWTVTICYYQACVILPLCRQARGDLLYSPNSYRAFGP